jgi:hypothetical protein
MVNQSFHTKHLRELRTLPERRSRTSRRRDGQYHFPKFHHCRFGQGGHAISQDELQQVAQNNVIIGQTLSNGLPDASLSGTFGIITPRTDGFKVSGVRFYNFPTTMTVFQSCSVCNNGDLVVTSGKASFFEGISYTNVLGKYIQWNGPRRNIFYDIDGSLSSSIFSGSTVRPNSTILPYYLHNDISGKCFNATNQTMWDTSLICDNTSVVRTVMITNAMPSSNFANT